MAIYVNPPNEEKEEFLARVGTPVERVTSLRDVPADQRLVVWKKNPHFSAAAIPENDEDLRGGFQIPTDFRPEQYYFVPLSELEAVIGPHGWERLNGQ